MSPKQFLKEFGHLAETEGGVEQLRKTVLQLAMTGRLNSGFADVELTRSALTQIDDERALWIAKGKIKGSLKPATPNSPLKSIPAGWLLVSLSRACHVVTDGDHQPPPQVSAGVPFLVISDVKGGSLSISGTRFVPQDYYDRLDWTKKPFAGDLLYTVVGSYGVPVVVRGDEPFCVQRHIAILKPASQVDVNFLRYVLLSPQTLRQAEECATGTAQKTIPLGGLRRFSVPFPPLPEQKRIVEKVDELMALCDELEAKQKQKREKAVAFNQAALNAVVHASDQAALASSWSRLQDHFEVLYELPENVKQLRQTILQLAVMGKLAEHDTQAITGIPSSPNTSPFHRSIDAASAPPRLLGIPDEWACSRFGLLADVSSGVTKGRNLSGKRVTELPYLAVANVQRNAIDLSTVKKIAVGEDEVERYQLQIGDVVLTEGGDADKLGRSAVWRGELPLCLHQNHIFRARPSKHVLPEWLSLFTNSPVGQAYFLAAAKQTTNLASINMTQLRNCPTPVPSLDEQQRIVRRVGELLALCAQVERVLTRHREKGARLMRSVVESLVA